MSLLLMMNYTGELGLLLLAIATYGRPPVFRRKHQVGVYTVRC